MAKPKNTIKGHNAEREIRSFFKEKLGFSFCLTSRQGSRIHDDAGIDLVNVPYNVQIKAGYKRGLNIRDTIQYTKDKISELFPPGAPEHTHPTVVIHKQDIGRGQRRKECDTLVYMSFKDFVKLIKQTNNDVNNNPGESG